MTYEGLRIKLRNKIILPVTCTFRRKKLQNDSFTIISNNCWGGTIYESYGIQKQSPTIGMFFMASDYIKFLQDMPKYFKTEMVFIKPEQSKWKEELCHNVNWGTYPIAVLGDIELHLLHYHCGERIIRETWDRRIKRINWNRLLVKFNDQNNCTDEDIEKFFRLPYSNKLFFTCDNLENKKEKYGEQYIVIKQPRKYRNILASYEPFGKTKYVNITEIINGLEE